MTAVVPLKRVAGINLRDLPETTDPDYEFRYIDIGSVGQGLLVGEPQDMRFSDAPSRARRLVRPTDTIVSTVRTYLRAVWPVQGPSDDLVVSTGFAVLSPRKNINPRFLGWLARSDVLIEEVVARSVGVSYPAISPSQLGDIAVPVPPMQQQADVADFLDGETSYIDRVIRARQRMIHLLDQRFWAWFADRVSGVPGAPLRRVFTRLTDGPFGSAFSSSEYEAQGAYVVRLGNIGFAEFRFEPAAFIPDRLYRALRRHHVSEGDLLIAGLGDDSNHAGRACVAPDLGDAIVKGKCFAATINRARANPQFIALCLSSPLGAERVTREVRGSTRQMINLDIIKSVEAPLPSVEVQDAIVDEATRRRREVRQISTALERQLTLLQEHRQALITAAVTGQLDVARAVA